VRGGRPDGAPTYRQRQ